MKISSVLFTHLRLLAFLSVQRLHHFLTAGFHYPSMAEPDIASTSIVSSALSLPTEIWLQIFQEVARIEHPTTSLDPGGSYTRETDSLMDTRLVCKRFVVG